MTSTRPYYNVHVQNEHGETVEIGIPDESGFSDSDFSSTVWRKDRVAKSNDIDRLSGVAAATRVKCSA